MLHNNFAAARLYLVVLFFIIFMNKNFNLCYDFMSDSFILFLVVYIFFTVVLYSAKEICEKSKEQAKITEREKYTKLSKNIGKLSNKN